MARRINRFARLNRLLKATNGTVPATGEVAEYQKYLLGQNKIVRLRKPGLGYMKMIGVGVIPFGSHPITGTPSYIRVAMTVQADTVLSKLSDINDADLGLERTPTSIKNNTGSFYPALLKVAITGFATATDSQISGVTKQTYQRLKTRSGSIPFGRTGTSVIDAETKTVVPLLANVDEQDMKTTLRKKMGDSVDATGKLKSFLTHKIASYSFESEVFRANRQDLYGVAPSTLPTFPDL